MTSGGSSSVPVPPATAATAHPVAQDAAGTSSAAAAVPALLVYVCQYLQDYGLRLEKTSSQPAAELQAMLTAYVDKPQCVFCSACGKMARWKASPGLVLSDTIFHLKKVPRCYS